MQMMHQSLASAIFPGYRRQILGLLFLRPDESFHGREVARRTGLSPGTVTRELRRLAEVGLLNGESRGNQIIYGANRSCPVFKEVAGILRKTSGLGDELARSLATVSDAVRVAFVHGSMARGTQNAGSDVDLIVIGSVDFGSVTDALYPLQKSLGREVNPKIFSVREWGAQLKSRSAFTMEVLKKPKLFVIGEEAELAKLGRGQSRADHASR